MLNKMADPLSKNDLARDGKVTLRERALEEACVNRDELEKLYAESADVVGDLRYHLLWCLSQTERACRDLECCAKDVFLGNDDQHLLDQRVGELSQKALQLRQEARALLDTYVEEVSRRSRAARSRQSSMRLQRPNTSNSGRFNTACSV